MNQIHYCIIVISCMLLLCVAGCDDNENASGHSTSRIPVGAKCEIVLKGDIVVGLDRMITAKNTSENINGSRDSVCGRVHEVNKDWIAVSLADIKVEVSGDKTTTFGVAGRLQEYVYYIPKQNIAFIRTWK